MSNQPIETYGLETVVKKEWLDAALKSKPSPQFYIDSYAFARGGTEDVGGFNKEWHGRRLICNHYPWIQKTWNDWSEMQLWAWCNYEEIGATGCMNAGKSFIFSFLAWLEYMVSPMKTTLVLSSTTKMALKSRIWYHIKRFRAGLILNGHQTCHPSHIIDSQTLIQAVKGDDMHVITAVAVQGGKLEQAIGNIQGRHPERMLIFVDEGEQTPEAIYSGRFNLRGGTKLYKFISAANAVNPYSAYGQFIQPVGGWSSVKDSDEYWETKTGICLHFDGLQSPNVRAGTIVAPGLINQGDIDAIKKSKGDDSLEWWMYVRGFPAMSGVRNTVLNWANINAGKATLPVIWQGSFTWICGLDPAFTSGGDNCVLQFAKVGLSADGMMTMFLEPPITIKLKSSSEITEDYQIAEEVKLLCNERGVKPEHFAMDATSASGLASIIEQRWQPGIQRVNFGSSATEKRMPDDEKPAKERCKNRSVEMWMVTAALVRAGQVRGLSAQAAQEFCMREYKIQGEKYVLESKADMKARTGGKSPDFADGVSLCSDTFHRMHGVSDHKQKPQENDSWKRAAKKYNLMEV